MLSIVMFMLSELFLLYFFILLSLFPLKFCKPFCTHRVWLCSQMKVLVIGWWEWVYGMYCLNKQHLMARLAKVKLFCIFFSLGTRLSLLLYPFFRHLTQADTCGCVVVFSIYTPDRKVRLRILKSWEWLLFMQLCLSTSRILLSPSHIFFSGKCSQTYFFSFK